MELFAGGGFFGGAFLKEGFRPVRAIELDSVACATYRENLGDHVENGDVAKAVPSKRCDLLIAGPPCQGFSTIGKRNRLDRRNFLSLEVLKWAEIASPRVVVIENVPAFLDSQIWPLIEAGFRKLEYDVATHILNAYDFGVPQLRKRAFVIASKVGLPTIRPLIKKKTRTVREAWSGLSSVPDGRNHHYAPKPSELALSRMRLIPEGGNKSNIMSSDPGLVPISWWSVHREVTDVWGRMEWNKPSNTLRTCFQNPSKGRYIHPEQNRVISLREAARLHSIEDSWRFCGLPTQISRQIGNSVPPRLGRTIARGIRELFN